MKNPLLELKSILEQLKKDLEIGMEKDKQFREDIIHRIEKIENFLHEKMGFESDLILNHDTDEKSNFSHLGIWD